MLHLENWPSAPLDDGLRTQTHTRLRASTLTKVRQREHAAHHGVAGVLGALLAYTYKQGSVVTLF